ncbi:MAG: glycosyltransferase, partial [Chloroflexi bacterium]|nr:glycosyltransferase [Chloroflexota bacterium]
MPLQPLSRGLALVTLAYGIFYLAWRTTSTLNFDALGFALLLLAAEIVDITSLCFYVLQTWSPKLLLAPPPAPGLSVDFFVTTYNEDLEILEATLTGCKAVRYPHTTYVLDDGRRPAVRALAQRLGCQYLTRPDNAHAKAGNINAALARTRGDFIAVLDADMVPQPDYLDQTLGYFTDPKVALVQGPQEFYNRDSVQHARGGAAKGWHEQSLFFHVIQPGRNHWNAAFWCGSPSVLSRAALADIGGVATETVTEDMHTTIRLHARGWRTVYHDKPIAYGIAPQTLHAFAVQRLRWSQGTLQVLRSPESPLRVAGLTLAQRLNYLACALYTLEGHQDLVYVLTPVLVLLTGIWPLTVGGFSFLAVWLPLIGLKLLTTAVLSRGHFRFVQNEEYSLLKMFTLIRSSLALFWPDGLRFKVTPKQFDGSVRAQEWRQVVPQVAMVFVLGVSGLVGLLRLIGTLEGSRARPELLLPLLWAVFHIVLLTRGVASIVRRLHKRQSYRFPASLQAVVQDASGNTLLTRTEDISLLGCGLLSSEELPLGLDVDVALQLSGEPLNIRARVVHRSARREGGWRLGLSFMELGTYERERLALYVFVTLPGYQGVPVK